MAKNVGDFIRNFEKSPLLLMIVWWKRLKKSKNVKIFKKTKNVKVGKLWETKMVQMPKTLKKKWINLKTVKKSEMVRLKNYEMWRTSRKSGENWKFTCIKLIIKKCL